MKFIGHGNPDNNLESSCIMKDIVITLKGTEWEKWPGISNLWSCMRLCKVEVEVGTGILLS
jgi:hypothetical protein